MTVSVLMPYHSDSAWRDRLRDWVVARYKALLPEAELVIGTSTPFNRAAARNDAYRRCSGDVLIVADADTVPQPGHLRVAISVVRSTRTWVLPYSSSGYYNLTRAATEQILAAPPAGPVPEPSDPADWEHRLESWGGLQVMTRDAWETVGGYDERFVGWGYEDNARRLALDALWAPHLRLPGWAIHLWHDAPETVRFGQPNIDANRRLFHQYERAALNASMMQRVVPR